MKDCIKPSKPDKEIKLNWIARLNEPPTSGRLYKP